MKKTVLFWSLILFASHLYGQIMMDIEGSISVGNSVSNYPESGTIQWTGDDFEAFNGASWLSLTDSTRLPKINGHILTEPLTVIHGPSGEQFGSSIDMNDRWLVVGAPAADIDGNSNQGCLYVFEKINGVWISSDTLANPTGAPSDFLGRNLKLSDSLIVSYQLENASNRQGEIVTFEFDGSDWVHHSNLVSPSPQNEEHFGRAMILNGDELIVGAYGGTVNNATYAGSIYIFHFINNLWQLDQTIFSDNVQQDAIFGYSIALANDILAISAPGENIGNVNGSGRVSLFEKSTNGYTLMDDLVSPTLTANQGFGFSISFKDSELLIGSSSNSINSIYLAKSQSNSWMISGELNAQDTNNISFGNIGIGGENSIFVSALKTGPLSNCHVFQKIRNTWFLTHLFGEFAGTIRSINYFDGSVVIGVNNDTKVYIY